MNGFQGGTEGRTALSVIRYGDREVRVRIPSLVEQAALELRAEVRGEHAAGPVDQQRHLVAHEADVALGVGEHGQRGAVRDLQSPSAETTTVWDTPGVLSTKLVINQFRFCAAWLIAFN